MRLRTSYSDGRWRTGFAGSFRAVVRRSVLLAAIAVLGAACATATATAAPVPVSALGINIQGMPPNLHAASAAGVGVSRIQVISGTNPDALVALTAAAGVRLYPELGLPSSQGPAADAIAMTSYVSWFAGRYGSGGTFWAAHPELPYLPVRSYEIGNEPDITPTEPADRVSLHYADPASYALVYEASRTALHAVEPDAQAVVGGLLDSSPIPLADAEQYLRALGPIDAVGFHPYVYDLDMMESDTQALRQWLDSNGHRGVPLDVNEFGSADGLSAGIGAWAAEVTSYTTWALCTASLHVENVQPFWWGANPGAAPQQPWYRLFNSDLTPTPLGSAYLSEVTSLTYSGCPVNSTPGKPVTGGTGRPVARRTGRKPRHSALPIVRASEREIGHSKVWVLSASGSRAAAGRRLVSYRWALGRKLLGSHLALRRAFRRGPTYTVTLTVRDNRGGAARLQLQLRMSRRPQRAPGT